MLGKELSRATERLGGLFQNPSTQSVPLWTSSLGTRREVAHGNRIDTHPLLPCLILSLVLKCTTFLGTLWMGGKLRSGSQESHLLNESFLTETIKQGHSTVPWSFVPVFNLGKSLSLFSCVHRCLLSPSPSPPPPSR